ncbi:C1 family peptidase [Halobacteriovorax sp. HLS]|uniref:C1 family peptidase n=1 Tax=Halobacteriovorax sp. HLS TaxID=2234000 RepID=UPI000FD6FEE2|nr:C1 family peptidase [Halobacteriovorax sp. HLS]
MKYIFIFLLCFNIYSMGEGFESPYIESKPAINDLLEKTDLPKQSDVLSVIDLQTSVKSQKSRGTCTMFTTIGLLEHYLVKYRGLSKEIDLSEEWMEYVIMTKKTSEGSSTSKNFKALIENAYVSEAEWPYLGKKWTSIEESPLAASRCSHLRGNQLQSCFLGHRDPRLLTASEELVNDVDPEFLPILKAAKDNRPQIRDLLVKKSSYRLKTLSKVKELLVKGSPVIMGAKLYYGSWNHSKTDKLDIQPRDKSKWYEGIVTYPERGSRDRRISSELGGGHSLIIVGYDDEKEVTSRMLMEDGTWKDFTYKGVYYFKNSWGVRGSGKRFELDGVSYPGYGMITQKYAHDFGTFFHIPVKL